MQSLRFSWCCILFAAVVAIAINAAAATKVSKSLEDLDYRLFPTRTSESAAVLEWGHSAIISAIDASVAHFGPQTSQAALLEVECQPVLASPLNGMRGGVAVSPLLDNAADVHGNMVVMTNTGNLTGVAMAQLAKASGAAALLVVNIDEHHPDDVYRLSVNSDDNDDEDNDEQEAADLVDIPVIMISLNSANVLTTATVTPDMEPADIVNHGMPDRVRLYAAGDRPFFEDVEPYDPTLYLIHNLLTEQECDALVQAASTKVQPVTRDDFLQFTHETDKLHKVERVVLWKGGLVSHAEKQIEERMEQVTGFPSAQYSDFIIDRFTFQQGSHWKPHYDTHPTLIPMATVTVFLTNSGGPVVYPSCDSPVKILPRKGMAIVHHNTNEHYELDMATLHATLPPTTSSSDEPVYMATKYVFTTPVSRSRRIVLPLLAMPFGGKLPHWIVASHDFLVTKFGPERASVYFDKLCIFVPLLILLGLAQFISDTVQAKWKQDTKTKKQPKKGGKKD